MKQRRTRSSDENGPGSILIWKDTSKPPKLCVVTTHGGINKCMEYIAQNFSRPIHVENLAKVAGLSRRGFHKAFEKHVGLKPGSTLRNVRLQYAKHLLVEQDGKLDDIVRQCGFESTNTFCVAFRRVVGISPKKFQRQQWLEMYRLQQRKERYPLPAPRIRRAAELACAN